MLHHVENAQNQGFNMPSEWTEEEWDNVALELRKRFPARKFNNYFRDVFSLEEFEDAAETVISQERQRSFDSLFEVRRPLFQAFLRINDEVKSTAQKIIPVGKTKDGGVIVWGQAEWEAVVLEFHERNPDAFSQRLAGATLAQINKAVRVLDFSRQRYFNVIEQFRGTALRTWDALPPEVRNPLLQDRPIIEFPNGPIMAPPKRKNDDTSAIATAVQKAFSEGIKTTSGRKPPVHWNGTEWLLIAREMHRQDPLGNLLRSTFPRLDLGAIKAAQRKILPRERHRALKNPNGIKPQLIAAFAHLKEEIESGRKENDPPTAVQPTSIAVDGEREFADISATQEPLAIRPANPSAAAPQVSIAATSTEMDFYGKLLNAAAPLLNLLVDEVAKRLAPSLIQACLPAMESAIKEVMRNAVPVAVSSNPVAPAVEMGIQGGAYYRAEPPGPLSKQELAQYLPTPTEKPKKLKIAVLMPFGQQQKYILDAYPEYEFVFIEHGEGIEAAGRECVLFVALESYMTPTARKKIKAHVPVEKLKHTDGGISAIKRVINIWKAEK